MMQGAREHMAMGATLGRGEVNAELFEHDNIRI